MSGRLLAAALVFVTALFGIIMAPQVNPRLLVAAQREAYQPTRPVDYIPLGDSYTIGSHVEEADRYANQLAVRLTDNGLLTDVLTNPAQGGFTSQQLIDIELPAISGERADLITVLIGMNDYLRSVSPDTFRANLEYIVGVLPSHLNYDGTLLLITLPDAAMTPRGAVRAAQVTSGATISQFNSIIKQVASEHSLPVADIYTLSQQAQYRPDWLAVDNFHPSGEQYTAWSKQIYQTLLCDPNGFRIKQTIAGANDRPELGLFGQPDQCSDPQALRLADARLH